MAELLPSRGKGGTFARTIKQGKADFVLYSFDMVGKGGLGDIEIFGSPVEIQGLGKLQNAVNLFGVHGLFPHNTDRIILLIIE